MDELHGHFFEDYPSKSKGRPFLKLSLGMKFWKLLFFCVFFLTIYETADMGMWLIFLFSLALRFFLPAAQVRLCFKKIKRNATNKRTVTLIQEPTHQAAILATAHPFI